MHVAVDDDTGVVLRAYVRDFLVFEEMRQFPPDPTNLPDGTFEWDAAKSFDWLAGGM